MLRSIISILAILLSTAVNAGEAGRIVFSAGTSTVGGEGAVAGHPVQEGDEVATGKDGYVYIKTVDDGFLILRPNSRARIVSYFIDPKNPANTRVKLELLQGVARSISGAGVKHARHNFRFNTPVAAIGVRGTDFTVFTDRQVSRVAVISGGIVVSGFGGLCNPEGSGPCEGNASRELFAHQAGQLLQVSKGQLAPQLLKNSNLMPDAVVPPRIDEPAGKSNAAPLTAADPNFEAQKGELLAVKLPSVPSNPIEAPPANPTPVPPPLEPAGPPELLWGRWQPIAELSEDADALAKLKAGNYENAKIIESFFISRVSNSSLVLPKEGKASFALASSEAYITTNDKTVRATVQDPKLDIDFGSRVFSTSLTLSGPSTQVKMYASGDITLRGELVSQLMSSNARVTGYLGGANAKEAGYLFRLIDSPAQGAFGATYWTR